MLGKRLTPLEFCLSAIVVVWVVTLSLLDHLYLAEMSQAGTYGRITPA